MNDFYQKIEAFLLNELTTVEREAFETAMASDEALSRAVAQHRKVIDGLDTLRIRRKVQAAVAGLGPARAEKRYWRWVFLAVFLFGAMIINWQYFRSEAPVSIQPAPAPVEQQSLPDTKQPQVVEPAPPPRAEKPQPSKLVTLARLYHRSYDVGQLRSESPVAGSQQTPLQAASDAYARQQYRAVLERLRNDSLVKQDEAARYLRGSAYFLSGSYAQAAEDFEALQQSLEFGFEARWNNLLCQLALGRQATVLPVLRRLAKDPNEPFQAQAEALLRELHYGN